MISSNNKDPFQLDRFLQAQEGAHDAVLSELRAGRKQSHWMWFVFPEIEGLGSSPTASQFAIKSIAEAEAYLHHPILGPRLRECTTTLLSSSGLSASDVFGYPDDLKFCSSMTLFDHVAPDNSLFADAISKYCEGHRDEKTLAILHANEI
ncbi:MAG: DUF1810 domain-containing protein [Arenicellales bacterium]